MSGLVDRQGGVYRILAPLDTVQSELAAQGWTVAVLPEVDRTRDFYAGLRTALNLPAWTGSNLDALWDVLTDLTEPTALVWRRYATFAAARPERWQRILTVLEERADQDHGSPFAVVLV